MKRVGGSFWNSTIPSNIGGVFSGHLLTTVTDFGNLVNNFELTVFDRLASAFANESDNGVNSKVKVSVMLTLRSCVGIIPEFIATWFSAMWNGFDRLNMTSQQSLTIFCLAASLTCQSKVTILKLGANVRHCFCEILKKKWNAKHNLSCYRHETMATLAPCYSYAEYSRHF